MWESIKFLIDEDGSENTFTDKTLDSVEIDRNCDDLKDDVSRSKDIEIERVF